MPLSLIKFAHFNDVAVSGESRFAHLISINGSGPLQFKHDIKRLLPFLGSDKAKGIRLDPFKVPQYGSSPESRGPRTS